MKIVLLAGASSIHTIRWANGLSTAGHQVHVISQHQELEPCDSSVVVHIFPFRGVMGYFYMVPAVKRLLSQIKPDLVNAHYASGYATTARLVGYRPWLLSVWGSDVYDFPYKSPLHKWLVQRNLEGADAIASTSHCMAGQTRALTSVIDDIAITPFGVDMEIFGNCHVRKLTKFEPASKIVIGTVKSMAHKYGVDTLIDAFSEIREILRAAADPLADNVELRLVGDGPDMAELKVQTSRLGLGDCVTFTGRVSQHQVPQELVKFDIYVALSRLDSESFGVAIIEAGAAGLPVVVSDAGGLPEVVINEQTGLVVSREDPKAAAEAILRLIRDPELRHQMGTAGRRHVQKKYNWPACVEAMVDVYHKTITDYARD